MKKRLLALLTICVLVTTSAPLTVFAEKEEEKETQAPRSSVELLTTATQTDLIEEEQDVDADIESEIQALIPETMEDIYIRNVDDFIAFANNCKLDTWSVNKRVILTEDISLLGKEFDFVPSFGGIFDGQDHTISEYNVSDGLSHVGLFADIQKTGVIANLNVTGSIIPSGEQIRVGGVCGENHGYIKSCSFKGVISSNDYVGGIAAYNHYTGIIEDCTVSGYIKGIHFVGGIAGVNEGDISRCKNESMVNTTNVDTQITIDSMTSLNKVINLIKNVDSTSEEANNDATATDVGGIAGQSLGIISRCLNMGDVGYEHVGYNFGGIAGRQSGYVVNCTNNGKVLGRKDVGGIVGQAEPYITVDLSSDVAYQLTESISKLHDTVTATLGDAKNQSDVITNRLSAIQQYTAGAIEDVRYLSAGTVDFANGVSGATSEAFSRVDYILEESSKDDGVIDQLTYAAHDANSSADSFEKAVKDLNLENYLSESEKNEYQVAKDTIADAAKQYSDNYNKSYDAFYNLYIWDKLSPAPPINPADLQYQDENGNNLLEGVSRPTKGQLIDDLNLNQNSYNLRSEGNWVHTTDSVVFPVSDSEDGRYQDDRAFHQKAVSDAQTESDNYAQSRYRSKITDNTGRNAYTEDLQNAATTIASLTAAHLDEMTDATRTDAISSMDKLESAAGHLEKAGKQTKDIIGNVAGREDIQFPQFSDEYKLRTNSLATNMAGMNDNFGSLNLEVNNATGVLVDDLLSISDQFNNIMMLYTDAIDGVLEMDYTQAYSDVSLEEASTSTDATIEGCQNFGKVEGDIDTAGIAGTMAIEYDYDKESDLTGIKDSKLNSSFITKCVLRNNKNYGDAVGEKNYVAGVCGLQEMGTILGCSNYSSVKSSSGDYVGGVTGSSYSYIVSSFSKGILTGANYIGGISGDGTNIRNCLALVSIEGAESRYGAVAGNIAANGEVRNNFFVSDDLAGIDKISYSKKAEPVTYEKALSGNLFEAEKIQSAQEQAEESEGDDGEENKERAVKLDTVQYSDVPNDFKKLLVTFVLEDEDAKDGAEVIAKIKADYGDSISAEEYPGLKNKEGFYASWDVAQLDNITTDKVVTATYKRYRTTLSEYNASADLIQSELLVDGMFKEDDVLGIERTVNFEQGKPSTLSEYETLEVTIPDDGSEVHQIRFKPISNVANAIDLLGGYLGGDYKLYQIKDGEKVLLTSTGTMGKYSTYDIEGNHFTLSLDVADASGTATKVLILVIVIIIVVLVLLGILGILIKRNSRHMPKIFRKLIKNMSEKIENKEQLFYDDSQDEIKDKEPEKEPEKKDDVIDLDEDDE
ncbi:hypothetical protein D6855_13450 [Butyrivibrio sp. CB08]|uniref:GLUG motif-containing protein n=1 Tax=Butyrivibrio sp. CB08 TaxID=2364879 RepID=UPI000EAA3923|nr:GLUG motif-containing protein [Butyrivibrio sp. CB08]RKM57548.1 hypothetical protein D6855_13450 [Butyrivibrio sp. CB08]